MGHLFIKEQIVRLVKVDHQASVDKTGWWGAHLYHTIFILPEAVQSVKEDDLQWYKWGLFWGGGVKSMLAAMISCRNRLFYLLVCFYSILHHTNVGFLIGGTLYVLFTALSLINNMFLSIQIIQQPNIEYALWPRSWAGPWGYSSKKTWLHRFIGSNRKKKIISEASFLKLGFEN